MAKKEPFFLVFAPFVHGHLAAIDVNYDLPIRDKFKKQLTHESDVRTGNRKPVRASSHFARKAQCTNLTL